jgi:hypothetical protein
MANELKIRTESMPARCEICHQADQFDGNHFSRCSDLQRHEPGQFSEVLADCSMPAKQASNEDSPSMLLVWAPITCCAAGLGLVTGIICSAKFIHLLNETPGNCPPPCDAPAYVALGAIIYIFYYSIVGLIIGLAIGQFIFILWLIFIRKQRKALH